MYEAYWQLSGKPFANAADAKFYYPSEAHQGAMLKLRYAVESQCGAAVLAGGSGLGKTLLVQSLLQQLPERLSPRVSVVFPQMPPDQLLAYVAGEMVGKHALGQTPPVEQSVHVLNQVLTKNTQAGRHAVVVIDEAHLLRGAGSLETVRLLLNFEQSAQPALTVLLVGQTSLLTALQRSPELDERLGVKCLLRALRLEETIGYISLRLRSAGAKRDIFEQDAMEAVHRLSQGIPRRINRLCDLALLVGYAEEQHTIQAGAIESVSNELVALAPE